MEELKDTISKEPLITIKAINLITNEVIFESDSYEEVIKKAEESNEEYILDFETNSDYNFIF